jgi:hypothetical protein
MWPPGGRSRRGAQIVWRPRLDATLLAVILVATPAVSCAQAGWYVIPSLNLTEEFDDNVFGTSSNRKSDFVTRGSPSLTAGYRSQPLTLLVTAGFDAEFFEENRELSNVGDRKRADVAFQYLPTRTLTLGVTADYAQTVTPTELSPETGIELGRQETTLWDVSPSLSYRFTPSTSGDARYLYRRSVTESLTNVTQEARLGLSHLLTLRDTGTLGYILRQIEADAADADRSHAITIGWNRRLSPTMALSLEAGPRVSESDGTLGAEAAASLERRLKLGAVSVAYTRSETAIIGRAGTARFDSLSGSLRLEPRRSLQVNFGAFVSEVAEEGVSDTMVYGLNASVGYQITKWLSARATYRFYRQEQGSITIPHNIFSIGLDVRYPVRAD